MKFELNMNCISFFKVDLSENLAQPEEFIYLLLDDSECLVDFLEHFDNVS